MRNNEKTHVLAAILFIITAIVALMLAFANDITAEKIAQNTIKAQNEARNAVMHDATDFVFLKSIKNETVREIYLAKNKEAELGWCVSVAPNGYGGEVEFIVGIDKSFAITGIKIVNMSETPGLGAKAGEEKFTSQFEGKDASNGLSVIKSGSPSNSEILAISGATVTSNAIKAGVNAAIEAVKGGIAQ